MTPKEAFRKLSHKFHGKAPGKNKQEKRLKQIQEEMRRRNMSSTDTPLMTVQAMQQEQERTQSPYIVLTGSASVNRIMYVI
jgi:U4/U6.U5 tri-snRNP-associated protein 1